MGKEKKQARERKKEESFSNFNPINKSNSNLGQERNDNKNLTFSWYKTFENNGSITCKKKKNNKINTTRNFDLSFSK